MITCYRLISGDAMSLVATILISLLLGLGITPLYAATSNTSTAKSMPVSGMLLSTHPLYLIAQAVTQGIEQPELLLAANQSGHDIQLRPNDRKRLKQASLVLWFGGQYEAPLAHVLAGQPNAIALFELNAFKRLPLRDAQGKPYTDSLDPHIWLEPLNAVGIAHAIAAVRSRQFPQYASRYQQNARVFSQRLMQAANPYQRRHPMAYWAYHDAYQYLERSLNLQFKGSLTIEHDLPPTIRQLAWLQQQRPVKQVTKSMCLLAEGHADPSVLKRLQPVNIQTIDEIMLGQADFVAGWLKVAQAVASCAKT